MNRKTAGGAAAGAGNRPPAAGAEGGLAAQAKQEAQEVAGLFFAFHSKLLGRHVRIDTGLSESE